MEPPTLPRWFAWIVVLTDSAQNQATWNYSSQFTTITSHDSSTRNSSRERFKMSIITSSLKYYLFLYLTFPFLTCSASKDFYSSVTTLLHSVKQSFRLLMSISIPMRTPQYTLPITRFEEIWWKAERRLWWHHSRRWLRRYSSWRRNSWCFIR